SWARRGGKEEAPRQPGSHPGRSRCARRSGVRRDRRCGGSARERGEDSCADCGATVIAVSTDAKARATASQAAARAPAPRSRARSLGAFETPSRARVIRIRERLREVYGTPLMRAHGHPIAELILTVLSQSTNDRNRDVAYLRLRTRFPSWEEVRDAPVAEIEQAIRPGGISRVKAARIKAILRAITADPRHPPHELSLDWLPRVPLEEARDYLVRLPGVGRKTAACVLLFAHGLREV